MAAKPKKSAKKKSKAPKPRKPVEVKRKPRAQRLPGMEDAGFPELEKLAEEYADVRDQRMELTKQESTMNADLLALMKKHDKSEYHHQDVHVWIKSKDERVKVKIGEIENKQTSFEPGEIADESSESGEELEAVEA